MDLTGFNVYQGLAGAYLIHSAEEDHLSLPGTGADAMENHGYGVVDMQPTSRTASSTPTTRCCTPTRTRACSATASSSTAPSSRSSKSGDASTASASTRLEPPLVQPALSTGQPFVQVGNEGGLLPAPVAKRLLIAPAERADVVVDFTNAPSTVDLVTVPAGIDEADVAVQLLRFRVADGAATDKSAVPPVLRPLEPLGAATVRRSIRFERGGGQWVVNGAPFDPDRPAFQVKRNTIEEWTLTNNSGGWVHPIHIHECRSASCHTAAPPRRRGRAARRTRSRRARRHRDGAAAVHRLHRCVRLRPPQHRARGHADDDPLRRRAVAGSAHVEPVARSRPMSFVRPIDEQDRARA